MLSRMRLFNNKYNIMSYYAKNNICNISMTKTNIINDNNKHIISKYNKDTKQLLNEITIIKNTFNNANNDEILKFLIDYRSTIDYKKYDINILVEDLKIINQTLITESTYNLFNRVIDIKRDEKLNKFYKKQYNIDKLIYMFFGGFISSNIYFIYKYISA
jgi:hypothetical protein